jgi:hypothetical protein
LSETGARVRGAPASQAGLRGSLTIDGVGYPLPFSVKWCVDGALGMVFALDTATAAKFNETLERLGHRRVA